MIKMSKQKNNKDKLNTYARYSGIAFEMLVIIGGGTWAGYEIDESRPQEFPLFTVVLSLFSVFVALYLVIKQVTNNE